MKNLFDANLANQVKTRLGKLGAQSERRWGKMTAAQMLAHCSVSMQWAVGEVVPEKAALLTHDASIPPIALRTRHFKNRTISGIQTEPA